MHHWLAGQVWPHLPDIEAVDTAEFGTETGVAGIVESDIVMVAGIAEPDTVAFVVAGIAAFDTGEAGTVALVVPIVYL